MRNRIFGAIGVVWGGVILWTRLFVDRRAPGEAAFDGQSPAVAVALLLMGVGVYYLVKGGASAKPK